MRVLSVKQPWAGLAMAGVKRYEVRPWRPTESQGVLLLHASSGTAPGLSEEEKNPVYLKALKLADMELKSTWPRSAILGVIEIIQVWNSRHPPKLSNMDRVMCGNITGMALWEIARRWRFARPVHCHGKLHLWEIPADARAAVTRQVARLHLPRLPWVENYTREI